MPIGFSMALAQNEDALKKFGTMSEPERNAVLNRAHNARSEQEMTQIASGIVSDS